MPEFHAEPYLYLAAVTHKAALIAWGGFYFRIRGHEQDGNFKLVDDSDLDHVHPQRKDTIGARSEPYGKARVEVFDASGALAGSGSSATTNHCWITDLKPDTEYTYRVVVEGEEWGGGERRDWVVEPGRQGLFKNGRQYQNRFRTHPHPEQSASLTFAVLGDFGTGIRRASTEKKRQREVAAALERAVDHYGARLLLTMGDNIYAGRELLGIPIGATGDEDDDWFFTYYQPYRYLLNRIPVYPTVGNHDSSETEASDDRQQLMDNFYLNERFNGEETAGRASIGPGLFYRFPFGADIEFVCLDTSRQYLLFGRRYFDHPNHASFLDAALPAPAPGVRAPKWRIPFAHHPPYCAGPMHGNTKTMIESLVPRFQRSGVRVMFSGHEHNFQYSRADGIHYFVSGAGGKLRPGRPSGFEEAHTVAWASAGHILIVTVEPDRLIVRPIGELDASGEVAEIPIVDPQGQPVPTPIVIPRA